MRLTKRALSCLITLLMLFSVCSSAFAGAAAKRPKTLSLLDFASAVYDLRAHNDGEVIPDKCVPIAELPEFARGKADAAEHDLAGALGALEDEGFSVTVQNDSALLSLPYQTCRLIVKGELPAESFGETARVGGYNGLSVLQFSTREKALAAEKRLSSAAGVEFVEPDRVVSVCETAPSTHLSWGYGEDYVGVDTLLDHTAASGREPEDVTVAVIDTGVEASHPFLEGRVLTDVDYDFANNDDDAADDHNHGTHVAGTVVDGTPETVKILPIKALAGSGSGTELSVYLSINYAVEQGADVINLSLGGAGVSRLYEEAIDNAVASGVVVCVAAGNDGVDVSGFSPANVKSAVTVGATDRNNSRASFSNYGAGVDIAAPGTDINSALRSSSGSGETIAYSGTSMATPHVSAVAACIKTISRDYTPDAVLYVLQTAAKPLNTDYPIGNLLCAANIPGTGLADLCIGPNTLELYPGQTYQLPVAAAGPVQFTSSEPSVVSVSQNGTLTAGAEGEALITAVSGSFTQICRVSVSEVTIRLPYPSIDAYPGLEDVIPYECSHALRPSFASDNESVALISENGLLTPVSPGTALITLTAGRTTATVNVTVRTVGTWYDPNATAYTITNADELYELSVVSNTTNESFAGKTVTIPAGTAPIDLSDRRWLPIGLLRENGGAAFRGTFRGNRVPITGLTCRSDETALGDAYFGLFSFLTDALVTGVYLEDADVFAMNHAGGVAAVASGGRFDDCRVSGSVRTVLKNAGGVCAEFDGSMVSNCVNDAAVTAGTTYAGGIAAASFCGSRFVNCLNRGPISSVVSAGIVSIASDSDMIFVSYDPGITVASISSAGNGDSHDPSLDAENVGAVVNCVNEGVCGRAITHTADGIVFDSCWGRSDAAATGLYRINRHGLQPKKANDPELGGYNDAFVTDDGRALTEVLNVRALRLNDKKGDFCYLWRLENGTLSLNAGAFVPEENYLWFDDETVFGFPGETRSLPLRTTAPAQVGWSSSDEAVAGIDGNGTLYVKAEGETTVTASAFGKSASIRVRALAADWYDPSATTLTIHTGEELHALAVLVNLGVDDFSGKTVVLANDVDVSAYPDWEPISAFDAARHFCGTFDGQGHEISGLSSSGAKGAEIGLFGLFGLVAAPGELRGFSLSNVTITQEQGFDGAAVCGMLSSGATVRDVEVKSGLLTDSNRLGSTNFLNCIAGIVAVNEGTIENCVNRMTLRTYKFRTGGIAGTNKGVIDRCVNYGTVEGQQTLAGVAVGNISMDGVIANCANYGIVREDPAYYYQIADVVGVASYSMGKVYNCLNAGAITGSDNPSSTASGVICPTSANYHKDFLFSRCVNVGTVSGAVNPLAIGRNCYAKWKQIFWLSSSCPTPYASLGGRSEFTDVMAFDASLTLENGENLVERLNADLPAFNQTLGENPICCIWIVDEDGLPALGGRCGHPTTELRTVKEATCAEDGCEAYVCTVCGMQVGEGTVLPALGHVYDISTKQDPTCTQNGWLYEECSRCGWFIVTTLPATGHELFLKTHREPSCTRDGYDVMQCRFCSYSETATLPAIGHDMRVTKRIEPTCVEDGWMYEVCANGCMFAQTTTLPATGIHEKGVRTLRQATCLADGMEEDCCLTCGQSLSAPRAIPKTGHSYVLSENEKPTCTTQGRQRFVCSYCGDGYFAYAEPLGHSDANRDGRCDRCGFDLEPHDPGDPSGSGQNEADRCPYCHEAHTGFFGGIVGFFHKILYFFKNLF